MSIPPRLRTGSTAGYLGSIADGGLTSPQEITRTLTDALAAKDYSTCIKGLKNVDIDPQEYIDGLDKAIDILSPESDIHERCVRELSRVCGIYGLLPKSHEVNSILTTGQHAVESGGYSDVWKAVNKAGEYFAVKVLRMYEGSAVQVKKKYCKEVIISRRMNHPNVLRIEGVAPRLFECCMVSKWMERGHMLAYLNRSQEPVNRLELLLGIIRGLNYLHTHQVVHGDLKGSNIFINTAGIPCLADFGLSSIAEDIYSVRSSTATSGGSVRWSAPELVPTTPGGAGVKPTINSDLYSLAMVIVEAFTGKVPFPELVNVQVVLVVSKGGRPPRPPGCERLGLGPAVWKLTEECWNPNPDRRPDIGSVLRRFQAIVDADEEKPLPLARRIVRIGSLSDSAQQRINRLDQELDKGAVPEGERPAKLNELSKLCGNHKLVPDSMKLQGFRDNSAEVKEYKGPYSVYQSEFKGRKVAVKVLRLYVPQRLDDPQRRFCREAVAWKHLQHPNVLPLLGATITDNKLCLISEWADQGNIIQYLNRMEHLEVNRFELLIGVVGGLLYMHDLHMVHGNLKGENVYIRDYRACIAGFSMSTMAREGPWTGGGGASTTSLPTFTAGGTLPWMSPELLDPSRLGDPDPRPTKESDCFALGMVVYEVLCGFPPYYDWDQQMIKEAILKGVRPYKPDAAAHLGLVDELWDMLQLCWNEKREERPDLRTVRVCLDSVAPFWNARTHLPVPSTAYDTASAYTYSCYSSSPSPSIRHSPSLHPSSSPLRPYSPPLHPHPSPLRPYSPPLHPQPTPLRPHTPPLRPHSPPRRPRSAPLRPYSPSLHHRALSFHPHSPSFHPHQPMPHPLSPLLHPPSPSPPSPA